MSPLGPRTIRARIAIATFLVLSVVLGVAGAVIDRTVRESALRALDARLASEAEALAALTRYDGRRVELDFEDETMTSFAPSSGAYFQVTTSKGLVERSRSLRGTSLPGPDPADLAPLAGAADRRVSFATIPGPHEPRVRAVMLVVSRGAQEAEDTEAEATDSAPRIVVAVQVARSLAELEQAAARTRRALLLALPIALGLGTAGAFAVARRATRPIDRLAREAREIAAGSSSVRFDVGRVEGELRDLAQTLNGAFDRLASALDRERRLSADAAHELRTPIALARSRLELAMLRDREPAAYREAVGAALEAVDRLERISDALLLLARAEAGQFPRERVDLRGAIARAIETVEPLAQQASVSIAVEGATDELPVVGSGPLLERLLSNLIENAVRHGGSGRRVDVAATAMDRRAEVLVLDRGPGLPEDLVPRLFERFARGDASRARETGGTGLGLAIARTIARAHGGEVVVADREGGGAAVHVSLPLASPL
ncbi:MAG TPA: ATP-binding protein [Planctomycetota bacterium]|nr:ATP-binding protein [Planctomycetota bacterium]